MSEERIVRYTSEELAAMRERGETLTDWARVDAMTDEEIDTSDIPELDADFWENAKLVIPGAGTPAHDDTIGTA